MAFNRAKIIFTPFSRVGEIEKNVGGLMADYAMKGFYEGTEAEYCVKVFHQVENTEEPEPDMYAMSYDIGVQVLTKRLEHMHNTAERVKIAKEVSGGGVSDPDRIEVSDIQWSEPFVQADMMVLVGTLMDQPLSAVCSLDRYLEAKQDGFEEKVLEDMKGSILHSFRAAYRAVPVQINLK